MLTRKRQKKSVWLKIITLVVITAFVCHSAACQSMGRVLQSPSRFYRDKFQNIMLRRIVDVEPGGYVLSLNEGTQCIEPHRINGLLDMGIKPVYKLTTASGRSIRTTANHQYLVKVKSKKAKGKSITQDLKWIKVSDLKTGSEIWVPRGHFWSLSFGNIIVPGESNPFVKNEDSKIDYQKKTGNDKEDGFIHKDLPPSFHYPDKDNQCQYSGKDIKSQKIHDFLESILDSLTAILKNNTVMAMPIENVSQGIFPAASGTNTPTTNEAKINFAPSRKKSDITLNSSLDNIRSNNTIQKTFVKGNIGIFLRKTTK